MAQIKSREHLLNTLAEAAELEHNLLCLYLYASFSLKDSLDEDVSEIELQHINQWQTTIREIAIQEMGHFAIVLNLITSIGGVAHVTRPNFPVSPGYYPNNFILDLLPFNMTTLEHFIFLERPLHSNIKVDPIEKEKVTSVKREEPADRLMTYAGNYKTVGELYQSIEEGINYLYEELGEKTLFCGKTDCQLSEKETRMKDLSYIDNKTDAIKAIRHIVEQGEGGDSDDCHFQKFSKIKEEYQSILNSNPSFSPSRNVSTNPVMRKSSETDTTIWIQSSVSAKYLDCANALYNLMLRFLLQTYSKSHRSPDNKKLMVTNTFIIMKVMGNISKLLTKTKASDDHPELKAGMTFTIDRYLNPIDIEHEKIILTERVKEIVEQLNSSTQLRTFSDELQKVTL